MCLAYVMLTYGAVLLTALVPWDAEFMGVADKTVRRRIKEHGGFWVDEGTVGRKA